MVSQKKQVEIHETRSWSVANSSLHKTGKIMSGKFVPFSGNFSPVVNMLTNELYAVIHALCLGIDF